MRIPKELGEGIVVFDNTFFELDNFNQLFSLNSKYKIESIFVDGKLYFSVPEDDRNLIVTVKNTKIVDFKYSNDVEGISSLINMTNDLSLINYCDSSNDSARLIKSFYEHIEWCKLQEIKDDIDFVERFSKFECISPTITTQEDFEKDSSINAVELNIIKKIHSIKSKYQELNNGKNPVLNFRRLDSCHSIVFGTSLIIYENFFLVIYHGERRIRDYNMGRFYSLSGRCLSDKIYRNILLPNDFSREYSLIHETQFSRNIFRYNNGKEDFGVVRIINNETVETKLPSTFCNEMRCTYEYYGSTVTNSYIKLNNEYYDFDLKKLDIQEVVLTTQSFIDKYLYGIYPDHREFHYDSPYPKRIGHTCYIPTDESFRDTECELRKNIRDRPNFIEKIKHIKDYKDVNGEDFSLYLFECRPKGYCEKNGHIIYNFDPDKIVL